MKIDSSGIIDVYSHYIALMA